MVLPRLRLRQHRHKTPHPPLLHLLLLLLFLLYLVTPVHAEQGDPDQQQHKQPQQKEKERASTPTILLDIALPMTPKAYLETFWLHQDFYANFLAKSGDINVDIRPWQTKAKTTTHHGGKFLPQPKERIVVTNHPVATKFPGLPSHVKSTKRHVLFEEDIVTTTTTGATRAKKQEEVILKIQEVNEVIGVPFSDRFAVILVWTASWGGGKEEGEGEEAKGRAKHGQHEQQMMRLTVSQHVIFKRSFWLEKVVVKDSEIETLATLKLWHALALAASGAAPATAVAAAELITPEAEETTKTSSLRPKATGFLASLKEHPTNLVLTGMLGCVLLAVSKATKFFASGVSSMRPKIH